MNLTKRLSVGFLATALMIGSCVPAFAADTTQTVSTTGSQSATVSYVKDSTFTVTIPKTITLADNKTASYSVSATGDLRGNETIKVTPASSFDLVDSKGKANVTATVSQGSTDFSYDTLGQSVTGNIAATGLTAGNWSGTLTFTIEKTTA